MNDSFSGKNGKVKVMYVRSDTEGDNQQQNKRSPKGRSDKGRQEGNKPYSDRSANKGRQDKPYQQRAQADHTRQEKRPRRSDNVKEEEGPYHSPWKIVSVESVETHDTNAGESVEKVRIDPELVRRQRAEETRVYGENACQALFNKRPESIVRAWFVQSVTLRFRETLRWMAANKKAYHVVDDAELAKASGTEHHGGVCFIIKKRGGLSASDYLAQITKEHDCVLALENVANPHNLGGIMRSCAHFGATAVLLNDPSMLESGAAVRTAEGGAEHIQVLDGANLPNALDTFRRAGYTLVTTSSHKTATPLVQATLPKKIVLVLGEERDGLSDSIWQKGDLAVSITGTGNVESLNVSVATGILLAEWWRQRQGDQR